LFIEPNEDTKTPAPDDFEFPQVRLSNFAATPISLAQSAKSLTNSDFHDYRRGFEWQIHLLEGFSANPYSPFRSCIYEEFFPSRKEITAPQATRLKS
jgi:hypothetical protein